MVPVVAERKARPVRRRTTDSFHEFVEHEVKRSADIVKSIADNGAECPRNRPDSENKCIRAKIFITLNGKTPVVTIEKSSDRFVELRDVLVGPFDL